MNCELASAELVECARHHVQPDEELSAHVAGCGPCCRRWEAQQELTSHLAAMRLTHVPASLEWSKAVLLREFDAHQRRERNMRWMWTLSAAAVILLSVMVMRDVWRNPAGSMVSSAVSAPGAASGARAYPMREYSEENFAPAVEAGEQGFITVPFSTPVAPGEILRVVRAELLPSALARMGVNVEPGWTSALPADLLVGQDGFTHAVRLSEDNSEEKEF